MKHMAWLLDRHDMRTRIDAHTYKGNGDAFATTTEQADKSRRELLRYGLNPSKVEQVTSFGDAVPSNPNNPAERKNQRLEISIAFDKDDRLRPDLLR